MVETLEHLIRRAALHPKLPRAALYQELLRSETYLLTVDTPPEGEQVTRVCKRDESFPVWADKDPELGGVWVPMFPARDSVAQFVAARRLKAPRGKDFLWMGHKPGEAFPLLRGISCFAGVRLHLDAAPAIALPWSEVHALAQGRLPPEGPEIYDLPVAELEIPEGARLAVGQIDAGPEHRGAKLLCLPEAGHFRVDDTRKLVRLALGGGQTAWMACRHFIQVLRYLRGRDGGRFVDEMLNSLIGFQMYGEAEALCQWMLRKGRELYGWLALAAIYALTGRLRECAELCRRGAQKYPAETSFAVSGARALRRLGREEEARGLLERALSATPGDPKLLAALAE